MEKIVSCVISARRHCTTVKRFSGTLVMPALLAVLTLVTTAGAFAQSAENDFETSANFDGTITITKYVGWDMEVVIPAKFGGKAVTAIGREAFKGAGLTQVTIPAGIVLIGNSAFRDNKLTGVVIPEGVREIADSAFMGNPLESVTLPESVTSLGVNTGRGYSPFGSEPPATFILGANIGVGSQQTRYASNVLKLAYKLAHYYMSISFGIMQNR